MSIIIRVTIEITQEDDFGLVSGLGIRSTEVNTDPSLRVIEHIFRGLLVGLLGNLPMANKVADERYLRNLRMFIINNARNPF